MTLFFLLGFVRVLEWFEGEDQQEHHAYSGLADFGG